MSVLPLLEGTVKLPVAEAPPRLGVAVHGRPATPQRTVAILEHEAAVVLEVARTLDHASTQPGRAQTFERARPRVPGVDLVG